MASTLETSLDTQIKTFQEKINELNRVKNLISVYPDLVEQKDRWNSKYYSTPSINPQVDKVYFKYACGCCPDASLLAFFYKNEDGVNIYSDPHSIVIGEQNIAGIGDIPSPTWREKLRKYHIPQEFEAVIEKHFADNPPVSFDDDEDDED